MISTKAKISYGRYRTRKDNRYLDTWNTERRSKAYKKIAHRAVRRADIVVSGNYYRKIFDYQWSIY